MTSRTTKQFIILTICSGVFCICSYLFSHQNEIRTTYFYTDSGPIIIKGSGKYHLQSINGTKKNIVSWSQYGQDRYIDNMFNNRRPGFFVEIGGYDGETHSNTLFLEKERNWTGLLIEANPYKYNQMLKKDRKCYMVNACISNTYRNMSFVIAGGVSSANETFPDRHNKRIDRDRNTYKNIPQWIHVGESVTVKCYNLLSLLTAIAIPSTHIDYFSLDVEGAELVILNSINWNEIDIDVFTIETGRHRSDIIRFMTSHGYKRIVKLKGDDVFRKRTFEQLYFMNLET